MIEATTHTNAHVLMTIPGSPPLHSPASAPSMLIFGGLHQEILAETSADTLEASTSPPVHSALTPVSSNQELPQLTPIGSTDGPFEDLHMEPDIQLLEYAKERAVTWDDLKNRLPLFPGEEGGIWQFSTAEQIIRGEWL
jgi:hypothetical protein